MLLFWRLKLLLIQNLGDNKIPDHAKYITTPEFNQLTAENFAVRLTQANLVTKTDWNNELIRFNKDINSNKTKYL